MLDDMVRRAAAAVVLGIVLLVGGWSARSDPLLQSCELLLQTSTHACQQLTPAQERTYERRSTAVDVLVWSSLVLGALLVLGGWTVGRELGDPRVVEPADE